MEASVFTPVKAPRSMAFPVLLPSTRLRRKQPSPEKKGVGVTTVLISPKKRAVSTGDSLGSPSKRPAIVEKTIEIPNALSQPYQPLWTELLKAGQIIFDDFSLVNNDGIPRAPKKAETSLIFNLFPTTFAVDYLPPFLTIRVRQLPAQKYWPFAIAGMPLYLTTEEFADGFDHGRVAGGPSVRKDIKVTRGNLTATFDEIIRYLEVDMNLRVQEVAYMGLFWRITLFAPSDLWKLPMLYANLACKYYLTKKENHFEAARRLLEPTDIIRDDTNYVNSLRPGVMLSCKGLTPREDLLTTSGIAVRERATGKKFITVSSHGFPLGQEEVYHTNRNDHVIGDVVLQFGGTDISLVQLRRGLSYSDTPFDGPNCTAHPIRGFVLENDFITNTRVNFNSPFTGFVEGMALGISRRRLGDGADGEVEMPWVKQSYLYLGNGRSLDQVAGACGTAVVNDADEVVCFFRYAALNGTGIALGICGGEILFDGFELTSI